MSRRTYDMNFQLAASMDSNFQKTFKGAEKELAAMQKEIVEINKAQADISSFQKRKAAIESNNKKLETLKKQYDNIQQEMAETGSSSSKLKNDLLSKQLQIDKTTASIAKQEAELAKMGSALREAGIDTDRLADESNRLERELGDIKGAQEAAADAAKMHGETARQAFEAAGHAIIAFGVLSGVKAITRGFQEATKASIEFESAMTGVDKTTDLTDLELAEMSEGIKTMSTEMPATTTELAAMAEIGGQLGIAKENLLGFTEVMTMLSTATNMGGEEGATMLAQFANITQMDPAKYSNLGSSVVALGNNYATTEKKILEMAQGVAAAGSLAGMAESDILALSAATTSLGIETAAGATSMSKLISGINMAVATGEGLTGFAHISGLSAKDFKRAWETDAAGALAVFIQGLNDTERNGKSAEVALSDLGITETRMQRMILSLAGSGDLLNRTLETSAEGWNKNTALVQEASKRYATTQSRITMMENSFNNLKIGIGDALNPTINESVGLITEVTNALATFAKENPEVVTGLTAFAGVIMTSTVALTSFLAVSKLVAAASVALGTAFAPITAVIGITAGIAALGASLSTIAKSQKSEIDSLTGASREQYYELKRVNAEYEEAIDKYGATSEQAKALKYEVDKLNTSYEANKQTMEDFKVEVEAVIENHEKLAESYAIASKEIDEEERSAMSLAYRLDELRNKANLSNGEQEEMRRIVAELNRSVPDLGLSFDDVTKSVNMSTEAVNKFIEAQAEKERNEENFRAIINFRKQQESTYESLLKARENYRAEEEKLNALIAEQGHNWQMGSLMAQSAINNQAAIVAEHKRELDELNAKYLETDGKIGELKDKTEEYANKQRALEEATAEVNAALTDARSELTMLSEAYTEAYAAAQESISGQYDLWDEAASTVAISTETITAALQSQTAYWTDYNSNISALTEKTKDIEGLSDMIATFADGSEESVNAIAGMAQASDEELTAMVASWKSLQTEQASVSENLAKLETDFNNSVTNIKGGLEQAVKDMNLNSEAVESAKNTLQGFITGAEEMLPSVKEAYERVAQAGIDAIDAKLQIHSPSRVMYERGEMTWDGYINASKEMETEVKQAMAATAEAGVGATAVEAAPIATGGGDNIQITVSPVFNVSGGGDVEGAMAKTTRDIKEIIIEALEEISANKARRAYV